MFIDSCWNENLYDVNLKGDEESKKFKGVGVEFDVMFGNGNNCVCK
ncbi:hypothetical protein WAL17_10290 [Waltera acetigignens]